jgi:uncharacterized protein YdaL
MLALALSAGLFVLANAIPGLGSSGVSLDRETWPACAAGAPALENSERSALVLYDSAGVFADLSLVYADLTATLASHFGQVEVLPTSDYHAGTLAEHDATIYVGLNYAEPLPEDFLADVAEGIRPVLWLGDNLWQMGDPKTEAGDLYALYGIRWPGESASIGSVRYRDTTFSVPEGTAVHRVSDVDPSRATVLATAEDDVADRPVPYAVRSGNITWLSEIPLDDAWADDRYLVLADLLNDVFEADPPATRRALVRLEDVGPLSNPAQLREAADVLFSRGIPFSIALYPVYIDAPGERANRVVTLREAPEVVRAVEYMIDRGGTLVLHGYTHQYGDEPNPLSGRSADDFEFFRVYYEGEELVYDGPVPEDSVEWVRERLNLALQELEDVGLPRPAIFEFPHYGASEAAYQVVNEWFAARYDHTHVFSQAWSGKSPISPYLFRISPPYLVRDPYGTVTIPETLGFFEQGAMGEGGNPVRRILSQAETLSAVRGSVSSLFFHPYLGSEHLQQIVDGLAASEHEFVSPCTLEPDTTSERPN